MDKTDTIEYHLERSPKRRRTIAVLIRENRVIVRAPLKTSRARIDEIVQSRAAWIEKKLAENGKRAAREYTDGELFGFLGRDYPLAVSEAAIKRIKSATFAGGCVAVKAPAGLSEEDRAAWVRESLARWYRPRAKSVVTKTVAQWSIKTGLAPKLVRVKDLKRSWGICTRENISLNWRLVMAPLPIIEYVVVHELCHLTHKNHSATFYGLLASYVPDYKARRKALRELAPGLDL